MGQMILFEKLVFTALFGINLLLLIPAYQKIIKPRGFEWFDLILLAILLGSVSSIILIWVT